MKFLYLIVSIGIAQLAGVVGSFFTVSGVRTWYVDLIKPLWNPPSWVFGPVWITLYTLMGISSYLIWSSLANPLRQGYGGSRSYGQAIKDIKIALYIYGAHLALNALWSVLFFGLKNPGLAFAEIIVLLVFVFITTILFWRINTWAGILLLPYIAWVSFATFLNYTIWQLN